MTEKELMLSGKLYIANNKELSEIRNKGYEYQELFNGNPLKSIEFKKGILKKWLGSIGKNVMIIPPLYCDYGCNVKIGDDFFANYDCIFLDVNEINIGSRVMLGPRVSIYTAGHPIDKDIRATTLEYGYKVTIGDDVWIGGNTVINPGVTIGSNVVIGSGSVVTHDIEDGCVACGNPARVIRKITEDDKRYWEEKRMEREKLLK